MYSGMFEKSWSLDWKDSYGLQDLDNEKIK